MTTTFDTLTAARDLEAAGMSRDQAEAVAKAIRNGQGDLVTRSDLLSTETGLRAEFYKVALGIVVANAAITFGLLKMLL